VSHSTDFPKPGWVEHDAEEIYQNVLMAVRSLKEKNPAALDQAAWFSLTNQRETIVVFDRESGKPLHHAIVWQDRRGEDFCSSLRNTALAQIVQKKTGLLVDTISLPVN
jgi:glycerol kinase